MMRECSSLGLRVRNAFRFSFVSLEKSAAIRISWPSWRFQPCDLAAISSCLAGLCRRIQAIAEWDRSSAYLRRGPIWFMVQEARHLIFNGIEALVRSETVAWKLAMSIRIDLESAERSVILESMVSRRRPTAEISCSICFMAVSEREFAIASATVLSRSVGDDDMGHVVRLLPRRVVDVWLFQTFYPMICPGTSLPAGEKVNLVSCSLLLPAVSCGSLQWSKSSQCLKAPANAVRKLSWRRC
ncbi:hypothetical protein NDU88_001217 [Pleurodeles waltl]|uniref:Uncharacterized protein n=1 Tax=Pleurodeles waltl TaxID=8319 RepID=A0AAV7SYM3_PLEWA|nr:hypothetical protein NDU88_001217 [Pleurodeles waltl]